MGSKFANCILFTTKRECQNLPFLSKANFFNSLCVIVAVDKGTAWFVRGEFGTFSPTGADVPGGGGHMLVFGLEAFASDVAPLALGRSISYAQSTMDTS